MKIGIITLPLNYNYGGLLQAFALQNFLESNGHKVEILDRLYRPHVISNKKKIILYTKRYIKKHFLGEKNIRITSEDYYNKTYEQVCRNTDIFIRNYIHRRLINDFSEISPNEYDAFVVGSDQVWRVSYNSDIYNAFLLFAKEWKVKRVAYAISFGTDIWEYTKEQTDKCRELAKLFDAIGTREFSGVQLVENNLKVKATNVIDPTMLYESSFYDNLLKCEHLERKGDIMMYILDKSQSLENVIRAISITNQMTYFNANSKIEELGVDVKLEERIQPSVEEWLTNIKTAQYIITDSFHACVFSILYNKDFVVVGNTSRGLSRIYSILNMFGLNDRYAKSYNDINNILHRAIDYQPINHKIADIRASSSDFLLNSLK